jgi:hypothetical protein
MNKEILLAAVIWLVGCSSPAENKPRPENPEQKKDSALKAMQAPIHYTVPDLSPMDMVYFPPDYPLLKMTGEINTPPLARVIYSRPQKQKRKIFGELIKYNEPWRLGANEATEIEFFSPATIQNKTINPGRYILYCIPQPDKWTLVLNSNLYSWGLQQTRQKDLMQFDIPVEYNNTPIEYFTIAFEKKSAISADLVFLWDDVKAKLPVRF